MQNSRYGRPPTLRVANSLVCADFHSRNCFCVEPQTWKPTSPFGSASITSIRLAETSMAHQWWDWGRGELLTDRQDSNPNGTSARQRSFHVHGILHAKMILNVKPFPTVQISANARPIHSGPRSLPIPCFTSSSWKPRRETKTPRNYFLYLC